MIKVIKTYSVVTPESAENGDYSETGFMDGYHKTDERPEPEELSFRELVDELRRYAFASSSKPYGEHTWVSTELSTDYYTGEEEEESLHFAEGNPKYWIKALNLRFPKSS